MLVIRNTRYGVYRDYGQGAAAMAILNQIINYIELGMSMAKEAIDLAGSVQEMVRIQNQYNDAKAEAKSEGQSEEEAKQTARAVLTGGGGGAGTGGAPAEESKTPTWVYVAGGAAALALLGGAAYTFMGRKKR